jgi:predicted ATP-dependent serine protease
MEQDYICTTCGRDRITQRWDGECPDCYPYDGATDCVKQGLESGQTFLTQPKSNVAGQTPVSLGETP